MCYIYFNRRSLTKSSLEIAHQLYEISLQNTTQTQRQSHAALQTKINEMLVNIRLYEKGLRLLPVDLQAQLVKYLLKSHGTEVCNDFFFYVATECNLNYSDANLKSEQRTKIAQDCGKLRRINKIPHNVEYKLNLDFHFHFRPRV